MNRKVDISHKTIFFIAAFLGFLWLLSQVVDVIILLFIAVIFMSALSPLVDRLSRWHIPKTLAIGLSYLTVIAVMVVLIYAVMRPLALELPTMVTTLPHIVEELLPPGTVDRGLLQQELTNFSRNVLGFTLTVFSSFITFISIAVLTFYLLLDRERIETMLSHLFGGREERAKKLIERIEYKLGAWVRGQVVLSLIIGILAYLLLVLLQIPYALPLAIFAGLLEVVPVIGPIASSIPAIGLAFTHSPTTAVLTALGYLVIQQAESHFIVPQLMRKAVGINPLVVILAIAAGGKLLGIPGALLAVPITVVIQLVAAEVLHHDLEI